VIRESDDGDRGEDTWAGADIAVMVDGVAVVRFVVGRQGWHVAWVADGVAVEWRDRQGQGAEGQGRQEDREAER
jgi:phage/plasmid primase-like uncharacterized protein